MTAGTGVICVLGDAHIDVVALLTGPPAEETDTPVRSALGVGGQAANVAAWACALGGRSRLITARGTDPAAALVTGELTRRGVELAGPVLDGRTGVVIALSDGGGQRSMLTDRGVGPRLTAAALDEAWLDGCSWLHLPAYSLVSEPVAGAAMAAARAAAAHSARLSVDLSSTAALAAYGPARFAGLLGRLRPDVVFGTAAEAALVGPLPGLELIVKLGADGVLAAGRRYPAMPTRAVDSTGAGDAFAAGYLLGGIETGLRAAARAVATVGGMP
ncbi:MAG: carbohydrate kinase family protein [Streptosporangiaceae bacterium]